MTNMPTKSEMKKLASFAEAYAWLKVSTKNTNFQQKINFLKRQMGDFAFVRFVKNLGIPLEKCYAMMFQKLPKGYNPGKNQKNFLDLYQKSGNVENTKNENNTLIQ